MSQNSFLKNFKFSWFGFSQWKKLYSLLSKTEKNIVFLFSILALGSFVFLSANFYLKNTEIKPAVNGSFVEGIVGQPSFINPLYSEASDVDRDLTEILFSGLMKYDKDGKIGKDLADNVKIKEGGKIYEFSIKNDVLWSDGKKLTVDDIIFTIQAIQSSDYKSPLRAEWLGIEIERISDYEIRFILKKPSFVFLENTTLKIIPKHIWEKIPIANVYSSPYNLEPIGSGPYKFKSSEKDKSGSIINFIVERNPDYYEKGPFVSEINFKFFKTEEELMTAVEKGEITGFSIISPENYQDFYVKYFNVNKIVLPRYFAAFFNIAKSKILEDKEVRKALNLGTDKEEILKETLAGNGKIIDSPLMPEIYGFSAPSKIYEFNIEKAKETLEKAGFKDENNDGFREKTIEKIPAFRFSSVLNTGSQGLEVQELQKCLAKYAEEVLKPSGLTSGTGKVGKATMDKLNQVCFPSPKETLSLGFTLVTVDQPQLVKVANLLKNQWEKIGVKLEIKTTDIATLERDYIKTRDYEILLFGEVLGSIPDPFPFWHSSQKKDPGLNLSSYENKKADEFLEKGRESTSSEEQKKNYEQFQDVLIEDAPAIFIYTPDYFYLIKKDTIQGMETKVITDPSQRFSGIENWYISTKRTWKSQ
ncbi:MAG: ABC transporter substrate-binding protein [Candidatus Nealsonbacteria bacterium]|nr:ABC transporter substrate-binding protein [Candidatus Nealsonbacteria bacterium]